jgi:Xaa-Pro aminopeptidase
METHQMFSPQTYADRRRVLTNRIEGGLVLLLGNSESPRSFADGTHPFRQDSTFLYYLGLDQPDLAAVIDVDGGTTILFGTDPTIDHIVWMGDLPSLAQRGESAGVTDVRPPSALAEYLLAAGSRRVHYLPPYRAANQVKLFELLRIEPQAAVEGASVELIRAVVDQRNIKTDEEIVEIEAAVEVAVAMHKAAMRIARPGLMEYEAVAEAERVCRAAGLELSFQVIGTVRGEILHNHHHGNKLQSGDMFLLDAGAESRLGYAADLSSTMPVDAKFTDRQKIMYDLCLGGYRAAVNTLAPGVPFREAHLNAARVIAAGMKDLGLMKGDTEEAVQAGAHAMFFQCGTGHMMGLDVHDMEDLGEVWVGYDGEPKSTLFGLKSLRLARPMESGFVVTVEPGIYMIPQLMDLWRGEKRFAEFLVYDEIDKWRDFGGIRNEEDFLITADGHRRLGPAKPLTTDEVEALGSSC